MRRLRCPVARADVLPEYCKCDARTWLAACCAGLIPLRPHTARRCGAGLRQVECRLSVYALVPRALLARGDTMRLVLDSLALPTASPHAVRHAPSRVSCSRKDALHAINAALQACGASLAASFPLRTDCGPCRHRLRWCALHVCAVAV
jgi:hypothetical protein